MVECRYCVRSPGDCIPRILRWLGFGLRWVGMDRALEGLVDHMDRRTRTWMCVDFVVEDEMGFIDS